MKLLGEVPLVTSLRHRQAFTKSFLSQSRGDLTDVRQWKSGKEMVSLNDDEIEVSIESVWGLLDTVGPI